MLIDSIFVVIIGTALYAFFNWLADGNHITAVVFTLLCVCTISTGWKMQALYGFIDNMSCTVNEYTNDPGFLYWVFHINDWWRCSF